MYLVIPTGEGSRADQYAEAVKEARRLALLGRQVSLYRLVETYAPGEPVVKRVGEPALPVGIGMRVVP